ncbi:hypothetical protein KIN20_026423, partial [Parelaphostrongylus tenuis]
ISVPNCKSINVGHYCQQSGQVYDKLKKKEAPSFGQPKAAYDATRQCHTAHCQKDRREVQRITP